MFDGGVRSADVVADTDVSCLFLSYENLENDASEFGGKIRLKLVANIARVLSQKLRQATLEIKGAEELSHDCVSSSGQGDSILCRTRLVSLWIFVVR